MVQITLNGSFDEDMDFSGQMTVVIDGETVEDRTPFRYESLDDLLGRYRNEPFTLTFEPDSSEENEEDEDEENKDESGD